MRNGTECGKTRWSSRAAGLLVLAAGTLQPLLAQQPWQGEWGSMTRVQTAPYPAYTGARLTISACTAQSCRAAMRVATRPDAYCDAAGELTITSDASAVLHLPSVADQRCAVRLTRTEGAQEAIASEASGAECSYYCTPGGTFQAQFALRSRTLFTGDNPDRCYTAESAAERAVCADAGLAALETQWGRRADEVKELLRLPETTTQTPQQRCADANPAAECLRTEYHRQLRELDAAKQQWLQAETTPGDTQEADGKVRAIAGRYRRAVRNGDITGRSYRTTDTLSVRRASKTSIAYSVELSFYNGHQCSRSGTAEYRQSGSFVDHSREDAGAECFFELRPTAKGVELADPTGACRASDCGARGGYAGQAFSFAERVAAKHSP